MRNRNISEKQRKWEKKQNLTKNTPTFKVLEILNFPIKIPNEKLNSKTLHNSIRKRKAINLISLFAFFQ
jgi:hypothetical protein